jgi:hypothetical protein
MSTKEEKEKKAKKWAEEGKALAQEGIITLANAPEGGVLVSDAPEGGVLVSDIFGVLVSD